MGSLARLSGFLIALIVAAEIPATAIPTAIPGTDSNSGDNILICLPDRVRSCPSCNGGTLPDTPNNPSLLRRRSSLAPQSLWIPACAGMTVVWGGRPSRLRAFA